MERWTIRLVPARPARAEEGGKEGPVLCQEGCPGHQLAATTVGDRSAGEGSLGERLSGGGQPAGCELAGGVDESDGLAVGGGDPRCTQDGGWLAGKREQADAGECGQVAHAIDQDDLKVGGKRSRSSWGKRRAATSEMRMVY